MPVYMIQAGTANGAVKIGWTKGDPEKRRTQLQLGNHEALRVIRTINARIEERTQKAFWPLHIHGEWFRFCPTMLTITSDDIMERSSKSDVVLPNKANAIAGGLKARKARLAKSPTPNARQNQTDRTTP